MAVGPRLGPGDPARTPGPVRDAPVQGRRHLPRHARAAARVGEPVAAEQIARLVRAHAHVHADAGAAQRPDPAPIHDAVRIPQCHDAARDPGPLECLHAGRGAPGVGAGLQRHVHGGSPRPRAGAGQRLDLGVVEPDRAVPALAHDASGARHDRAHHRVRMGAPAPALRQTQGAAHEAAVVVVRRWRHVRKRKPRGMWTTGRNERGARMRTHSGLPPSSIPTVTVGPGIAPGLQRRAADSKRAGSLRTPHAAARGLYRRWGLRHPAPKELLAEQHIRAASAVSKPAAGQTRAGEPPNSGRPAVRTPPSRWSRQGSRCGRRARVPRAPGPARAA